jgi:uncharacterized protein involved in exopolysaccharide biosynthesis
MEQLAIFEVLRRRAWMIVALCLVAALAGYACSFLMTERYTASAVVLVRPQQPIQMDGRNLDKNLYDFPVTASMPVETPSKTYIEIIKSEALIGKVVASLDLKGKTERSGGFLSRFIPASLKDEFDQLGEDLQQDLKDVTEILKYGRLIEDDPFAKAVGEVRDNLTLDSIEDTYVFKINYAGRSPQVAAEVANRLANSFIDLMEKMRLSEARYVRDHLETKLEQSRQQLVSARERLESSKQSRSTLHELKLQELDVEGAQTAYQTVATEFKEADINVSYPQPEVRLVSQAVPPQLPSSPARVKVAIVSLIGGLLVGVGLALFLEYINRRVRSIADLEDIVGVKVLATIPRTPRRRWRGTGLR